MVSIQLWDVITTIGTILHFSYSKKISTIYLFYAKCTTACLTIFFSTWQFISVIFFSRIALKVSFSPLIFVFFFSRFLTPTIFFCRHQLTSIYKTSDLCEATFSPLPANVIEFLFLSLLLFIYFISSFYFLLYST